MLCLRRRRGGLLGLQFPSFPGSSHRLRADASACDRAKGRIDVRIPPHKCSSRGSPAPYQGETVSIQVVFPGGRRVVVGDFTYEGFNFRARAGESSSRGNATDEDGDSVSTSLVNHLLS